MMSEETPEGERLYFAGRVRLISFPLLHMTNVEFSLFGNGGRGH